MAENRNSTIYGLVATDEPLSVRYVGRTIMPHLSDRADQHRHASRARRSAPVNLWILEVLGRGANIRCVPLETDAPAEAEAEWIERLRQQPGGLLNTRSGGASGGVFDEAGRKRISEAAKQSYRSTNRALRSMGESSAVSRLTEPEVREMRDAYASGRESQRGLARRFGVHRNTVWKIVARHYWPHI